MTRQDAALRRFAPRSTRGLTLVELLVAVTILVIMILAFGSILSQGQTVVAKSQRMIRKNAQAAAIAQVFRRDVGSITADGFLHVGSSDTPALVFTATGSYVSRTSRSGVVPPKGNAAVICYSTGPDESSTSAPGKVLCREAHILAKPPGLPGTWTPRRSDVMRMYLSHIQMKSKSPNGDPSYLVRKFGQHAGIYTLPKSITHVKDSWPVLVAGCEDVRVEYRSAAPNSTWISGGGKTWTFEDRDKPPTDADAWPVALKLSFKISDTPFEVIAQITR